jgi:hypothetical protein
LLNTGGTLVASGMTAAPIVTPTGRSGFGYTEFQIKVTGVNVFLPPLSPGQFYWLNVTPIGNLTGFSFDSTTSGATCVGTPCGNDTNAFFNSNFFGATFQDTADQGQPYDYSMGVIGTVVGALTPTPTPTATGTPTPIPTPTPTPPGPLWYNGDFDLMNGLANERDTSLGAGQFASVYDNFNVTGTGWTITEVFSDNLENTNVTGAIWEIRSGTNLCGTGGTLVASGSTAAPVVSPTGRSGFGFTEFQVKVTGLNVFLPPAPAGQFYWLNVTPVGDGTGRSLITTTSGANCVGTPCGNDGMSFFNPGGCNNPDDFSMGVNGTRIGVVEVYDLGP